MNKTSKIEEEKRVVSQMIYLYCHHKEKNKTLCHSCAELLEYAHTRLSKCPFQEKKKTCRLCTVHCYRPDMRTKMKEVMRYAGPRMLFFHPISAVKHLWSELK